MKTKLIEAFNCLEKNQITEPIDLKISTKIENFNTEINEYNEYLKSIKKNYKILDSKPLHVIKMNNNTIESLIKIQWIKDSDFGMDVFTG